MRRGNRYATFDAPVGSAWAVTSVIISHGPEFRSWRVVSDAASRPSEANAAIAEKDPKPLISDCRRLMR